MRLIDADALENEFGISDADIIAKDAIRDAPTIDAVPVVRCENCIFARFNTSSELIHCTASNGLDRVVRADDFCSYGDRKEGAD